MPDAAGMRGGEAGRARSCWLRGTLPAGAGPRNGTDGEEAGGLVGESGQGGR